MVARGWGAHFEYFKYKGMMLELVRYTYYLTGKVHQSAACLSRWIPRTYKPDSSHD